jgi:hypothetical protein
MGGRGTVSLVLLPLVPLLPLELLELLELLLLLPLMLELEEAGLLDEEAAALGVDLG